MNSSLKSKASELIFTTNQWTGLYTNGTLVLYGLRRSVHEQQILSERKCNISLNGYHYHHSHHI